MTALTALTEPWTIWRRITFFPLHTYQLYIAPRMRWRIYTIRTTGVLHSSQWLQLCCSRLHNAWRCLCLSSANSHMPHSHSCLPLRFCHLLQYSLRLRYVACRGIRFAIITFYISEIYSPIFTLSSTMPSGLYILRWSIISLRCFFLLIRICIAPIFALLPVDITCSQFKPTMPSVLHILRWSMICLRCFVLLICIRIRIIAILALIPFSITGSQV